MDFVADPDGKVGAPLVEATDGNFTARTLYDVVHEDTSRTRPPATTSAIIGWPS